MKFYRIRFTLDSKIRGSSDYIKKYNILIPHAIMYWEEPQFIGNIKFEYIDFDPYLINIELYGNAKLLDLVLDGGSISTKYVVSDKLKKILEKNQENSFQFFKITLKNKELYDYWIVHAICSKPEMIDFSNSKILKKNFDNYLNVEQILIKNKHEFDEVLKNIQFPIYIVIEKIKIKEDADLDFFVLQNVEGAVGYFVSEKLKTEIEDAGCTGIEFQPSELSYNEWLAPGGERERVYGKSW